MWRQSCKKPLAALGSFRWQKPRALDPRQSAIGEIKVASTVRSKALLTPRLDSPSSVRTQQRKIVRLPSQSVIGEKNLLTIGQARFRPLVLTDRNLAVRTGSAGHSCQTYQITRTFPRDYQGAR